MSVKESVDIQCNSLSAVNISVDNVVQALLNHEEEVKKFDKKKQSLDMKVKTQKQHLQQLEFEKSEIDAQITTLKLRNAAYQKEHMDLRNAITVVKFQIEKIKESIEKAKAEELKDLEDFEKSVDEITEKFRTSQSIYDRKSLLEEIKKEREKKECLRKSIEELSNSYIKFNQERGLRARKSEKEELIHCVLPGSELFHLMQMTQYLDEVICGIKNLISGAKMDGEGTQMLERVQDSESNKHEDISWDNLH